MGIQWRESLAIGVESIDGQHKELLRRFDGLLTACNEGRGMVELLGLLDFLGDYTRTHFRDEEALQRLHSYPEYEAHRQEHESFIARIKALRQEIGNGNAAVHHVMETNNMLLKWLTNHISVVDKRLGNFLLERKV